MKPRRRYIAFEVDGEVGRAELWKAIDRELRKSPTLDRTLLELASYETGSRWGLMRCGHRQVGELMPLIPEVEIGGRKISLKILGVSGTMKAARKKFSSQKLNKLPHRVIAIVHP